MGPRHPTARAVITAVLLVALFASPAAAHDPLLDVPPPGSVPEAWDVIRQSVDNVGKLLETNQLKPIAFQIANCSPAIRALQADLAGRPDKAGLHMRLEALFDLGGAVITASREREQPKIKAEARYRSYRSAWDEVAATYPPDVRAAGVYACPMHPLDRHLDPADRCTLCKMKLVRRRIPSSTTYEAPGRPTMTLTAIPDSPLRIGVEAGVRARLARRDGTPVPPRDLLVMHTERVHLLIVDPSLGDYHHEHPTPTETPGEYKFAFTPRRPGPYRVFADVVPAETGVQEYVVADVPAAADARPGVPVGDRADRFSAVEGGLRYELSLGAGPLGGGGRVVRANEVVEGELRVAGPDGKPFATLEPVMGAYAHLVGFGEDRRTVVHIHPLGPEPTRPGDRGGPTLRFNLYAPTPGFYRLYAQVRVGGADRFVPFGLTVQPARPDAAAGGGAKTNR